MGLETQGAVDEGHDAVEEGNVFACARLIDMGHEGVDGMDGGDVLVRARVIDVGREAMDGDHNVIVEDDVLSGIVMGLLVVVN